MKYTFCENHTTVHGLLIQTLCLSVRLSEKSDVAADQDDDEVEWEDVDVSEECGQCGGTGVLARPTQRIGLQGRTAMMMAHIHYFAFIFTDSFFSGLRSRIFL